MIEEIREKLSGAPEDTIKYFQESSISVPLWTDLEKQYDANKHEIMTNLVKYPIKFGDNGEDTYPRTTFALQELAVNRLSQIMFSNPVEYKFSYDEENEQEKTAVELIERLYKVDNFIDSENMERAKKVNASCHAITVWRGQEIEQKEIKGQQTKYRLRHKTYSPIDGYEISVKLNENDDLLAACISYKDTEGKEQVHIYTSDRYVSFIKEDEWRKVDDKTLLFMPCVYTYIKTPVWGGNAGTRLVEQLEELESDEGMYIKKNNVPTFSVDWGEIEGGQNTNQEKSTDSRRIIELGKGGVISDITWTGASESSDKRFKRLRNAFFEQIQLPDLSFSTLIASNTSADNKEFLLSDSKQKAKDLGGEWEKLLYHEIEIVKEFLKVFFPNISQAFDNIVCRPVIKPFSVRTKKEIADYIAGAGDSMSMKTKVSLLNEVDEVYKEIERIEEEQARGVNLML